MLQTFDETAHTGPSMVLAFQTQPRLTTMTCVAALHNNEINGGEMETQLSDFEELESLDAPGWGEWVAGICAGAIVGGVLIYGGIAVGVAIT